MAQEGLSRDDIIAALERLFEQAEAAQRESHNLVSSAAARISRCELAILILGARQTRNQYIDPVLFGEPSWDILLDLYVRFCRDQSTSVSSACLAARVPATTALRHISHLEASNYVVRKTDPRDKRRSYLELTEKALEKIESYLDGYARWVMSLHRVDARPLD